MKLGRMILSSLTATLLSIAAVPIALAQDTPAEPIENRPQSESTAAPSSATTDAAAQAKAAFDRKFKEYTAIVREIERLQAEYQGAPAPDREGINAAMAGQVAHAQSIVNEMVEAGVEAYRLAPKDNQQIADLLESVARYYVAGRDVRNAQGQVEGGDQYERAAPIVAALVEGGTKDRELLLWGFLCAFMANDFDLAEKYLAQVQEAPPLESEPKGAANQGTMELVSKLAPHLDEYRQWWAAESKLREAEEKADDLPRVKLTTTKGEITLELFENEAPQTVANFLTLVKQGHFNGSPFHRVIAKFMAQGGSKSDDGSGRLGYAIRGEASKPNFRRHFRGSLSMGLLPGNPDSGGGQFFLTHVPTTHLDGQHTVFGRVMEGIDVVADLNHREPGGDPQEAAMVPEPDRILKAEVLRDRGHAYTFDKLPEP